MKNSCTELICAFSYWMRFSRSWDLFSEFLFWEMEKKKVKWSHTWEKQTVLGMYLDTSNPVCNNYLNPQQTMDYLHKQRTSWAAARIHFTPFGFCLLLGKIKIKIMISVLESITMIWCLNHNIHTYSGIQWGHIRKSVKV